MPVRKTLFDLTTEMIELDRLLEDLGGDVTDEQVEAAIDQALSGNDAALRRKLDGYVTLVAEYDARAEFLKAEAARLTAMARAKESHADRLRASLKQFFERTGKDRFETDHFLISLRAAGGKQALRVTCDPEQLPEEFRVTLVSYKPDQTAIRAALAEGRELVFASLEERGRTLVIK